MMIQAFTKAFQAKESTLRVSDAMDRIIEKLEPPKPKYRPTEAQMLKIKSIQEC